MRRIAIPTIESVTGVKGFISGTTPITLLTRRADADYAAAIIATWASRYQVSGFCTVNDSSFV